MKANCNRLFQTKSFKDCKSHPKFLSLPLSAPTLIYELLPKIIISGTSHQLTCLFYETYIETYIILLGGDHFQTIVFKMTRLMILAETLMLIIITDIVQIQEEQSRLYKLYAFSVFDPFHPIPTPELWLGSFLIAILIVHQV